MSLFVPRCTFETTEDKVRSVFIHLGIIESVQLIPKNSEHGDAYKMIYVHFKEWFNTYDNVLFQERVRCPTTKAKVTCDTNMYWIAVENTYEKKPTRAKTLNIEDACDDDAEECPVLAPRPILLRRLVCDSPSPLPLRSSPLLAELDRVIDHNELTEEDYARIDAFYDSDCEEAIMDRVIEQVEDELDYCQTMTHDYATHYQEAQQGLAKYVQFCKNYGTVC